MYRSEMIKLQKEVWGDDLSDMLCAECNELAAEGSCYCEKCEDKIYEEMTLG